MLAMPLLLFSPSSDVCRPAAAAEPRLPPSAIRAQGDAGISSWGKPWSDTCAWSAVAPPLNGDIELPAWLVGRWRVRSRLDGLNFPLGREFLSQAVPGVRMASILALPNIGNAPSFELEYSRSSNGGGVRPNWPFNAKNTLEAFWPDAAVKAVEMPQRGRLMLQYQAPTRSSGVVVQNVNLQMCSSEGVLAGNDFFASDVFMQDNVEQGVRTFYQILQTWKPSATDPNRVSSQQRIAAFLVPTDGKYFAAQGRPVALIDYSYELSRLDG